MAKANSVTVSFSDASGLRTVTMADGRVDCDDRQAGSSLSFRSAGSRSVAINQESSVGSRDYFQKLRTQKSRWKCFEKKPGKQGRFRKHVRRISTLEYFSVLARLTGF